MRVWIDVLTPKQALFFGPLYHRLLEKRDSVLVTTRTYRESVQTLGMLKIPHRVVGRHGGGTAQGKLIASGDRIVRLTRLMADWKPEVAVSFSSVETSRVAFGMTVPHVAANDSPHSWIVARLTVPISAFLCSPWIIRPGNWTRLGLPRDRVISYRALDPAAWLKHLRPNKKILGSLGLESDRPLIVLRTEEAFASYLMGRSSDREPVVGPVIDRLLKMEKRLQIVVSTRYGQQAPVLRKRFGKRIIVLDRTIDAASLLSFASFFIGSGGTMTVEAALLGIPSVSCFPGTKPFYISYLEKEKLVKTIMSPDRIARETLASLENDGLRSDQQQRGRALLDWMEDPIVKIERTVRKAPGKWKVN